MKLYYKPGACSLASHIALRESGAIFELEQVDTVTKKSASGEDYTTVNAKGYVPALRIKDGSVLTEGAAILQYIADKYPNANLAPKAGTFERSRLHEHLNFVASELHKAFGPFFAGTPLEGEARIKAEDSVVAKMNHFESVLADGRAYLGGDTFSVADAYLFVVSNWSTFVGVSLEKLPRMKEFVARVAGRSATQDAMRAEGLLG
jgi:glutathione S-transferase